MSKVMANILQKREKIGQALFLLAFVDILAVDYISTTSIPVLLSGRMIQAAIALLGIAVICTNYSFKEWIVIALAGVVSIISFLNTGSYFACELSLLILASKNIDKRLLFKIYIIFVSALTVFVGLAALLFDFGEVYQVLDFRGTGEQLRFCMGYNHPNVYHIILIQLTMALVWLCWEKIKWYHMIILIAINLVITFFTRSRTNFIMGTFFAVLVLAGKVKSKLQECKVIYWVNFITLIGAILLSGAAVLLGGSTKLLSIINRLWTGRLSSAYDAAYYSRVSLFSAKELQINCDMGFVKLLYNYGLIVYIGIFLLIAYFIYKNIRTRHYPEMLIIFAGLIFMMGESFSSGEFITRNILFIVMLGWGAYESNQPKKQNS